MARSNYPYDLRNGQLKESVRRSMWTLADSLGPTTPYQREEYFDLVREMYPQIDDDDLWDEWREWYDSVAT